MLLAGRKNVSYWDATSSRIPLLYRSLDEE